MGKRAGLFIALFDISKGIIASLIGIHLFPQINCAKILSGSFCILGHIFPFLMKFHGGKVGSILVTPSSTSKMNLRTIASSYGEFTPLVLEGTVLFQTKDKNPVYLFDHSQALAPLAQRFGTPDSRQFIQGAEMILYKDLQETAPQP